MNRAAMFTPGQEKRIDPTAVLGAVRPTMSKLGNPASPPSTEPAVASSDCVFAPASESELAPDVVPVLNAELSLERELALDPGLAPDVVPVLNPGPVFEPELAFDPGLPLDPPGAEL